MGCILLAAWRGVVDPPDMKSAAIMPPETFLDEDWQIVVVVDEDDLGSIHPTIRDVQACSIGRSCRVLAVDSPPIRAALESLPLAVDYLLPAGIEPDSFWVNVISHTKFVSERTVFVRAGVQLPIAWDARLVAVAQTQPAAAIISPLVARNPILSAFSKPQSGPKLSVGAVDQWLNDYASGQVFSLPIMPEACLVFQGDYWNRQRDLIDTDAELYADIRADGSWVVATDQVYVDDSACGYPILTDSLPEASLTGFENHHPLASLRHALWELCVRGESPELERDCLPVQLHIGHSWGGGLNRWITNYLAADTKHHHLVLRSVGDRTAFGQQIALYGSADMQVPLRTWVLAQPILSTVVSQFEYEGLLNEVITQFNVESVVISSFIGHALDSLRTGLPTTLVLHDFFPFCPALYACFESPCQSCDSAALKKCHAENPLHSFFKHEPDDHWQSIRQAYDALLLAFRPTVVAPNQSVIDRYKNLQNSVAALNPIVIPHGLDGELVQRLASVSRVKRSGGEKLNVLVLGRMTAEKGADLLQAMVAETSQFAQYFLLGAGEEGEKFRQFDSCTVVDNYELEALSGHVIKVAPDIGLLLSVVPETFSYTLSELWAMGIPVLATQLGAFGDRIEEGENGWLAEPDAAQLSAKLLSIHTDAELLEHISEKLSAQKVLDSSGMVDSYNAILPKSPGISIRRFFLPRQSFQNPYRESEQQDQTLRYIERTHGVEATYRGVLREFLQYSAQKAKQTQRIPGPARWVISKVLTAMAKVV